MPNFIWVKGKTKYFHFNTDAIIAIEEPITTVAGDPQREIGWSPDVAAAVHLLPNLTIPLDAKAWSELQKKLGIPPLPTGT